MQKLQFSTRINAPKEKIWELLWSEEGYRKWTSVFSEGSYAESDWEEGSPIRFLSPSGDGMYSRIQRKVPNRVMIFEHEGEIRDGKETPTSWAGSTEGYFLEDAGEGTELKVELDTTEDAAAYFNTAFPKALEIVRELAEQ